MDSAETLGAGECCVWPRKGTGRVLVYTSRRNEIVQKEDFWMRG